MSEVDRLAGLLVPPHGEDSGVVQATILSWDPDTFANELDVDGVVFRDVDVGSGIEALTYRPGNVVLLRQQFPGGRLGERGIGTTFIDRRIISPGTGAAEKAIAFMATALAKQLSAGVFEERVHSSAVDGFGNRDSSTYGDLDDEEGPLVQNVDVVTGTVICWVTARISIGPSSDPAENRRGIIGVETSGATSRDPATFGEVSLLVSPTLGEGRPGVSPRMSGTRIITGLTPGTHTFKMQYRRLEEAVPINIGERELVVMAL